MELNIKIRGLDYDAAAQRGEIEKKRTGKGERREHCFH
jgi:hypothetical protein